MSGVNLVLLGGDKLDTSTPIGKLMLTVLGGIAEFETDMIKERQTEGIAHSKQRGVYKGRPKPYTESNNSLVPAMELYDKRDENKLTVNEISKFKKVSRVTLYQAVGEKIIKCEETIFMLFRGNEIYFSSQGGDGFLFFMIWNRILYRSVHLSTHFCYSNKISDTRLIVSRMTVFIC